MPATQDILAFGLNPTQVEADSKLIVAALNNVLTVAEKLDGKQIEITSSGNFSQLKAVVNDVNTTMTDGAKATDALTSAAKRLAVAQSEQGQKLAEIKVQQTAVNKSNTDAAKQTLGLVDAYSQLSLQYAAAARSAKNLSAAFGETSPQAIEAANTANALGDRLKVIDASVGQFQRNVGNYTGALSILKQSLSDINSSIGANTAAMLRNREEGAKLFIDADIAREKFGEEGEAYVQVTQKLRQNGIEKERLAQTNAKLNGESVLLADLVGQQSAGFTSLTQELRSNERALQTLRAAGLEGTEAFERLQIAVSDSSRSFKDFQRSQKLLEGEAPALQGLITAARGLGSAYAIGASASILFGDSNDKLSKDLNVLVATISLLQGLEEANALINQKSGIITALRITGEKIITGIFGEKTVAVSANTTATELNTAAETENISATEGETAAQSGLADALGVTTVSAEGAAGATSAFASAGLVAVGAVIAVVAALGYAIKKGIEYSFGIQQTIDEQNALVETFGKLNQALIDQAGFLDKADQGQKRYLENQLTLSQAAGENQLQQFAIRKELVAEELRLAQQNVDSLGANTSQQAKLSAQLESYDRQRIAVLNDLSIAQKDANSQDDNADKIKNLTAVLDALDKKIGATKGLYEATLGALDNLSKAQTAQGKETVEEQKFNEDEQRKLTLETVKLQEGYIKAKNASVLSNDRSTLNQRLAAIKSNLAAEKAIIEADKNNVLNNPSSTPTDKRIAIKTAGEQQAAATLATNDALRKQNEEDAQKTLQAQLDIAKSQIDLSEKTDKQIADNQNLSLGARLGAYNRYVSEQKQLINDQYAFEIQQAGQTPKQLEALEKEHQNNLTAIDLQGFQDRRKILLENANNVAANSNLDIDIGGLDASLNALKRIDAQLKAGTISLKDYKEAEQNIINTDLRTTLNLQIETLEKQKKTYEDLGESTKNIDKQILTNRTALRNLDAQQNEQDAQKKLDLEKKTQDAIFDVVKAGQELIFSLLDDGVERQKNAIQKQIDQNTRLKDEELTRITGSTLSEQQKANEIQIINARAQAQNEQLQLRQKKLDEQKAKFDRDASIANIIENTATAVIKSVAASPLTGGEPFAALAIALGAIQLAAVLATPIPKYWQGTDYAKGGLSIVGEKGAEFYQTPSGNVGFTPSTATLVNLERGTRIVPHHELTREFYHQQIQTEIPEPKDASVHELKLLKKEINDVKKILREQTGDVVSAFKTTRRPIVHVHDKAKQIFWEAQQRK